MNIYDALRNDHDEVKEMLTQLVSLDDDDVDTRNELVDDIRDALIPHSRAEEAVFYNALRENQSDNGKVWHGFAEHAGAEALLRTLQATDAVNFGWRATAEKLKESLEHHIEEEETELFAQARAVLSDQEAEMIGRAFESLKPKIQEESIIGTTLEMVKNLMPPRFSKSIGLDTPKTF